MFAHWITQYWLGWVSSNGITAFCTRLVRYDCELGSPSESVPCWKKKYDSTFATISSTVTYGTRSVGMLSRSGNTPGAERYPPGRLSLAVPRRRHTRDPAAPKMRTGLTSHERR